MKLPVLESIISGEWYQNFNYNPEWDWEKVNRSEFSENNPFDFECMKNLGRALVERGGRSGVCAEITPFFNKGKVMSLTFLHGDGYSNELEWISRELELVCEQLRFFNTDYIEQDVFNRILVEFLEYIIEKAKRYGGTKEEKIAFNKWICYFYGFYIESLQTWVDATAKNARKLTDVFNDARVDPSPYGDFGYYLHKTKLPITYQKAEEKDEQMTNEESDFVEVKKKLAFLNGEYEGERLMSEGDFERLMRWVEVMIKDRRIEEDVEPIVLRKRKDTKRAWNKDFLKCALREVHDVVYEHKNDSWIEFMARVLGQKVNTIKSKFRDMPNDYEKVKQAVTSGV